MHMLAIEVYAPDGNLLATRTCEVGVHTIGRSATSDLRVRHRSVARRHAFLVVEPDGARIEDSGSRRGTWKDRERIRTYGPLLRGDVILFGDCRLHVASERRSRIDERCDRLADYADAASGTGAELAVASAQLPGSEQRPSDETAVLDRRRIELRQRIQEQIVTSLNLYRRNIIDELSSAELRKEAAAAARRIVSEGTVELPEDIDPEALLSEVVAEAVGLGPLEEFLADDSVSEVMINGPDHVYVERHGRLTRLPAHFTSAASLMSVIDRIVTPLGRRIDEGSPLVDARLPDGSRVNAIIPPLSLVGPVLTIRKFAPQHLGLGRMVEVGTLSEAMAEFLKVCVRYRRNIIVSGGTGTGKTTFLNALSEYIPEAERIVTIEDSAELRLDQEHVVALESRPANIEGSGEVTIRELLRNALRMRPDRIVVGECRGGEALDMLQAMNTGHDGSLTTAHANAPRDALARLEVMTLMAGMDLPSRAIREQIASAVGEIVQLTRFADGRRRVLSITEVDGMESDVILTQELFRFRQTGVSAQGEVFGRHEAAGSVPRFYTDLRGGGVDLDVSVFAADGITEASA